jgi:hypothetical protein
MEVSVSHTCDIMIRLPGFELVGCTFSGSLLVALLALIAIYFAQRRSN